MGSRGASARVGYSFDGTKSRSANIQAAYNSIKDKGNGTLADFKDMVDYETRGADGYGLKDGIEAAIENYSDTYGGNSMGASSKEASEAGNGGRVIQVLDGKKNVVFEGFFDKYQDYIRAGKFKDSYSTRIVRK